jgi:hypothetical protein
MTTAVSAHALASQVWAAPVSAPSKQEITPVSDGSKPGLQVSVHSSPDATESPQSVAPSVTLPPVPTSAPEHGSTAFKQL